MSTAIMVASSPSVLAKLLARISEREGIFSKRYGFSLIKAATSKFAPANKLGEGGFGPVYKGIFPNGQMVAVKRLSNGSGQGDKEFKNEVEILSKLQHRGLVRLLGYCIHGAERFLVYELLPNGSLDALLFDPIKRRILDWKMRFNIIEEIAGGLVYLHRDSRLRIIHRDLKASNILLDEQYKPKISDFGTARIFRKDQPQEINKRVVGTLGYMPLEYAMGGEFSEKSDVFSYGVLVQEISSGRRSDSLIDEDGESLGLLKYAFKLWKVKLWKENRILELIDSSLGGSYDRSQALKCIKVGLLCVQESPKDRPSMPMVVSMLSSDTHLPEPKPVASISLPESIEPSSVSYVTATESDTHLPESKRVASISLPESIESNLSNLRLAQNSSQTNWQIHGRGKRWLKLLPHQLKINTDGAWNESSNEAGIGYIVRDNNGQTLLAVVVYTQCQNAVQTELLAIKSALLDIHNSL